MDEAHDFYVIVIDDESGEEVRRLGPMAKRTAERVLSGILMQLNHDQYSADVMHAKADARSAHADLYRRDLGGR